MGTLATVAVMVGFIGIGLMFVFLLDRWFERHAEKRRKPPE